MFGRFGISQKIYGAFGALVVLLAFLCVAGYLGVQSVAGVFSDYRHAASQSLTTSQIVRDVEKLRMAALRYQRDRNEDTAGSFTARLKGLMLFDPAQTAVFTDDAAAMASITNLQNVVGSYGKAFAAVTTLDQSRQELVATMAGEATKARGLLGEITTYAKTTNDPSSVQLVADITSNALQMIAAVDRYVASASDADFKAVKDFGQTAEDMTTELSVVIFTPEPAAKAQATVTAITDYLKLADQLDAATKERATVEATQLDSTGLRVTAELDALQKSILGTQASLGGLGETRTSMTQIVLMAVGGIAVLLGILMAILIGRWLSGTIRGMASDMERIANGDLDIEVKAARQRHELGMMAKALEIFRTNGLAIRSIDEQKAVQAATEAQQREVVAVQQREVERVVAAALAGDFAARVDDATVHSDASGFAQSLNDVMTTVQRGVGETADMLDGFAHADLSRRMTGDFAGAFGALKTSANLAADNFSEVVRQLQGASRELKVATGEILAGANDLSERTTKQAATIAETSTAIEQLQGAVNQNATKTNEVAAQTLTASRMADEGGQVMQKATAAMERITQSSSKISNIIGLIDDIAFQTNLLALNASVEAARAGEAGKGFAVVAVEVRRLAQSAAQASSEVKALVETSATEVRGGSRLVEDAAAKLAGILGAVRENSTLVSGISAATQEQAAAISEVNLAIRRMDEMTQHNAALVEETNASIEQTEAQASELDRIADTFTLQGKDEAPRAAPARHEPAPVSVQKAARRYVTQGNTAVDPDWEEF
ncbi:MAG: methyl-accepting chemotaxis protein [Devosia sp.]